MNPAEQMMDLQKTNLAAWTDLSVAAMTGLERLISLQIDVMKTTLDSGVDRPRQMLGQGQPQDMLSMGGTMGRPMLDTAINYGNEAMQIIQSTAIAVGNILDQHLRVGATRMSTFAESVATETQSVVGSFAHGDNSNHATAGSGAEAQHRAQSARSAHRGPHATH
jgi:phasin family protein